VGELEALGERRLSRASGIIRNTIGEVRRGDGVSEYGRRIDIGLEEVISDNPSIYAVLRCCVVVALARPTRRGTWRLSGEVISAGEAGTLQVPASLFS
jgi:hypothetical protein